MVPSLRYVKKRSPSLHKTYLWQVTRSYSNPKHPTRLRCNICHIFCARQFLDIVHFIQLAPRKTKGHRHYCWRLDPLTCSVWHLPILWWRTTWHEHIGASIRFGTLPITLDYHVTLARRPKYDNSSIVRTVRNGVMIYWLYVLGAFLGDDLAISISQNIFLLATDISMTQQVLDAIIIRLTLLGFDEV